MLKSCTKKYTDESDERTFRFTFYCDLCGEGFCATPVSFTGGNPPGEPNAKKAWEAKWRKEHYRAFERANFEARYRFHACPGCGLLVCDKCVVTKLLPDGGEKWERCVACEQRVKENSRPYLRYVYDPRGSTASRAAPDPPQKTEKRRFCLWPKKTGSQA